MRQVGTSLGGANGFGASHEDLGGSGAQAGGQSGVGLRRDGRDGAPGREGRRERGGGADVAARSRSFEARIDEARRRLARGASRDEDVREGAGWADRGPASAEDGQRVAPRDRDHHPGAGSWTRADEAAPDSTDERSTAAPPVTLLSEAEARETTEPRRLLAVAEPPVDAIAALFAAPPRTVVDGAGPAATEAGSAGPSLAARIAGIADQVERAMAADLAAESTAPIALRIPLDGVADGGASLTVVVTGLGLDITLAGGDRAAPKPELIRAAQGLAERLQRRLGRGSVRIFETGAAEETAAGWMDLSAILRREPG